MDRDIYFFCDFVLLRQLIRVQDKVWLVCKDINQEKYRTKLVLHGYPKADRVVIKAPDTPLDWGCQDTETIVKISIPE